MSVRRNAQVVILFHYLFNFSHHPQVLSNCAISINFCVKQFVKFYSRSLSDTLLLGVSDAAKASVVIMFRYFPIF